MEGIQLDVKTAISIMVLAQTYLITVQRAQIRLENYFIVDSITVLDFIRKTKGQSLYTG